MDPLSLGLMLVAFAALAVFMSRSNRKARERMEQQRREVVVVGNDVMTTAGFYGRIVDIDGDAITLASPSGDETVWDRRAISQIASIPLAVDSAEEEDAVEDSVEAPTDESDDDTTGTTTSPFSN